MNIPYSEISPDSQHAARSIRAHMGAQKLTSRELSKRTGISQPTFSRIYSGSREINLGQLRRISLALGVEMRVLLETGESND